MAEAEQAVRHAVDLAERDASVQLESVVLSMSCGRPGSEFYAVNVNVAGSSVTDGDVARALAAGCNHSVRDGRVVLHSLPIGYALDGVRGVGEPRGMLAREIGVDMHVVTADIAAARNLMLVVERCHLEVETMVASPYVAGLSDDRRRRRRYRRRADRPWRRHHDDGGVLLRALHLRRRLRDGRQSRHDGLGTRAERSYL